MPVARAQRWRIAVESLLYYREVAGDGDELPPAVVLHGLFGSSSNWQGLARRLDSRRRVILPDLRNHGRSFHDPAMGLQDLAADVRALLARLDPGPVDLIGHSLGGKVAMVLALEAPELVRRLVVVDIAPGRSPGEFEELIEVLRRFEPERYRRREEADAALAADVPDPEIRGFLLKNLSRAGEGFTWTLNLPAIANWLPMLREFPSYRNQQAWDGPALFLGGATSPYLGFQHEPEIRRLFPQSEVKLLPGVGHWLHHEAPGAVAGALEAFLGGEPQLAPGEVAGIAAREAKP